MKPKATYRIVVNLQGLYELFHGELLLAKFSRLNFREVMEKTAVEWDKSSNWIGSILRLLNQTYPVKYPVIQRTDFDRFVDKLGNEGLADYLRSKGFRVVKKTKFDDIKIIRFLEKDGYEIDGFIGDVHYSSEEMLGKRYAE